jgi:fibronectin-binding autotransporter adhesin
MALFAVFGSFVTNGWYQMRSRLFRFSAGVAIRSAFIFLFIVLIHSLVYSTTAWAQTNLAADASMSTLDGSSGTPLNLNGYTLTIDQATSGGVAGIDLSTDEVIFVDGSGPGSKIVMGATLTVATVTFTNAGTIDLAGFNLTASNNPSTPTAADTLILMDNTAPAAPGSQLITNLTIGAGGALQMDNNLQITGTLSYAGAGALDFGAASRTLTASSTIATTSGGLLTIGATNGGTVANTGTMSINTGGLMIAKSSEISGALSFAAASSLDFGAASQTLTAGSTIGTTAGDLLTIGATNGGTIANTGTMTINTGGVTVSNATTISGALAAGGASTWTLNGDLTYSGAAISVGANTLTLAGTADFLNSSAVQLGAAASVLDFTGTTQTVSAVELGHATGKVLMTAAGTITTLTHTAAGTIDLVDQTLTVTNGISAGTNNVTLAGTDDSGILSVNGNDMTLSTGTLSVSNQVDLTGALVYTGAGGLDIAANKQFDVSGTVTVPAPGIILNTVAGASSALNNTGNVNIAAGGAVTVANDFNILGAIAFAGAGGIDFGAASKTLTAGSTIGTTAGGLLTIGSTNGGTIANTGTMTINTGGLLIDKSSTISGALSFSAASSLDFGAASQTLTAGSTIGTTASGLLTIGTTNGGTIANTGAMTINTGGLLIDKSSTISGALSFAAASSLDFGAASQTLTAGSTIGSTAGGLLTIGTTNGGTIANTGTMSINTGGLLIDKSSEISGALSFTAASSLDFGAASQTLTAGSTIGTTAGGLLTIGTTNGGTIANTGAMTINTGGITITNATTISGALAVGGSGTWTLNADLTYSNGTAISVGAYTLTLAGSADLLNTGVLTLDNAGSIVDFTGTAQTVSSAAFTDAGGIVRMTAAGTITTLNADIGGVLDLNAALTIQDAALVVGNGASGVLEVRASTTPASAALFQSNGSTPANITLGDGTNTGTLTLTHAMAANVVGNIIVAMNASVINVDASNTVGTIMLNSGLGDVDLQIANGVTLTSGAVTANDNTVTFSQDGTLANASMTLANATAILDFSTVDGGTVAAVDLASSGKIVSTAAATVTTLTMSGDGVINLAAKTLIVSGGISAGANNLTLSGTDDSGILSVNGNDLTFSTGTLTVSNQVDLTGALVYTGAGGLDIAASKQFDVSGAVTVPASGITLNTVAGAGSALNNTGNVAIADGGAITVANNFNIMGPIVPAGAATFTLTNNLTYGGTAFNVGANTLTLAGTGSLSNTNAVVLNDAASVLDFTAAATVSKVESGNDAAKIDAGAAGTISTLSFTGNNGVNIDFSTASTFTVTNAFSLPTGGTSVLLVSGSAAGTLTGGQITVGLATTKGAIQVTNSGGATIANNIQIGGTNTSLDIDASVTFSGVIDASAAYTLDMTTTDGVTTTLSGSNPLQNAAAGGATTITMTGVNGGSAETLALAAGGLELSQDMTFALTDVTVDYSALTKLILASGAGVDATFDPGATTVSLAALTNIGGDGTTNKLILASSGNNVDYTISSTAVTDGNLDINESSLTISGQLTITGGYTMTLLGATDLTAPGTTLVQTGTFTNSSSGTVITGDLIFNGSVNALWNNSSNWLAGVNPTANDGSESILIQANATFNEGSAYDISSMEIGNGLTVTLSTSNLTVSGGGITIASGANTGTIDLNAQTITASGSNTVAATQTLVLTDGAGSGTFAGDVANSGTVQLTGTTPIQTGTITMAGGSAILDVNAAATVGAVTLSGNATASLGTVTLTSSGINLSGNTLLFNEAGTIANSAALAVGTGTLDVDAAVTVSGVMTVGAGTLDLAADLTYSNATAIALGANTLTLSGTADFLNTGKVQLSDASSVLNFTGPTQTVSAVEFTNAAGEVNMAVDGTITTITMTTGGVVDLDGGNLTVASPTTGANTFILKDTTPASTGQLIGNLTVAAGGTLQVNEDVTLTGTLSFAGTGELDFGAASKTLTTSSTIATTAAGLITVGSTNGGTITNTGTMTIDTGGLTVTNATIIGGPMAIGGSGTWTLNGNLTYSNASAIAIGAYTLTLAGANNLINTGNVQLNDASSVLSFTGTAQAVTAVEFTNAAAEVNMATSGTITTLTMTSGGVIDLDGGNLTITSPSTGANTLVLKDTTPGSAGQLIGNLTVAASGTLQINESVTVTGTLSFAGAGAIDFGTTGKTLTTSSTISTTNAGLVTIGASNGGTIANTGAFTINTGGITISAATSIGGPLAVGGSSTWTLTADLTYSDGTAIAIGANTLTLAGTANVNNSGVVQLNDASSVLDFTGTTQTVSAVELGNATGKVLMTAAGTITTLTHSAAGALDLAGNQLTVTNGISAGTNNLTLSGIDDSGALSVNANDLTFSTGTLSVSNQVDLTGALVYTGAGGLDIAASKQFDVSGVVTVPAAGITLNTVAGAGSALNNTGNVAIASGGALTVANDFNIMGPIVPAGAATITLTNTLTYGGAAISAGANTLTLAGTGSLLNTNAVVLDNASSVMDFTGAATVSKVESGDNAATITANAAGTITTLSFTAAGDGVSLNLVGANTLTIANSITATANAVILVEGTAAGTLAGGLITIEANPSRIQVTNSGGATIANNIQIGGANTSLDIDASATFTGIIDASGAFALDMNSTDGVTTTLSGSNPLQNAAAAGATTITMTGVNGGSAETLALAAGGLELSQNITFALTDVTVDYTALTKLILASGAGVDATFDPGITAVNLAGLTNIGGDGIANKLILASAGNNVDYTISGTAVTDGNLDVNESSITVTGQLTISSGHTLTLLGATDLTAPNAKLIETGTLTNSGTGTVITSAYVFAALSDNSWTTTGNWIAGVKPTANNGSEYVILQASATFDEGAALDISTLEIGNGLTLTLSNSNLTVSSSGVVISTGANTGTIDLNAQTITATGANTVAATQNLVLTDGAASGTFAGNIANSGTLQLTGTTPIQAGTITMAGGASVLDVNAAATVGTITLSGNATLSPGTVTLSSAGINLSGNTLLVNEAGTIANSAALAVGAGTLDVDAAVTLSGDMTVGSGTLDLAANLTYSSATTIAVGANTLTLAGTANFLNTGIVQLDNASSILDFTGTAQTVSKVDLAAAGGKVLTTTAGTISTITMSGSGMLDLGADLTNTGAAISVGANTLTLAGTANFVNSSAVQLDAATSVLDFTGTTQTVSAVELAHGTGKVLMTVAGTITTMTHSAAGTIDLADQTLTITNGISAGANNITLSGTDDSGILSINGNDLTFSTGTLTVSSQVDLTGGLVYTGAGGLDIAAGKQFDVSGAVTIPAAVVTLNSVAGAGSALNNTGNVSIASGGALTVANDFNIMGPIVPVGVATFTLTNHLTYGGAAFNIGANTLTLAGTGSLLNTNAIVLDNAASVIDFTAAATVSNIESGNAAAKIDAGAAGTISALSFTGNNGVNVDFTTTDTFTVTNAIALPTGGTAVLLVSGTSAGTLNGGQITVAAAVTKGAVQVTNTGGATIVNNVQIGGTNTSLDIDASATFTGIIDASGAFTVDMSTTDGVTTILSGSNPLQNAAASGATTITMTGVNGGSAETLALAAGGMELSQSMTFALTDVTVDYAALTKLIVASGAGVDATFDPGVTVVTLAGLLNIGGDGVANTLILSSAGNNVAYTISDTAVTDGNLDINESSLTITEQLTISTGHTLTLLGATDLNAPDSRLIQTGTLVNSSSGTVVTSSLVFTGAVNALWNNTANWLASTPPTANDGSEVIEVQANLTFNAASGYNIDALELVNSVTVTLSNSNLTVSGAGVTIASGANTGTIDLNAQTLTASGSNNVAATQTLVLTDGAGSGTFAGNIANSGALQLTGTTPVQTGTVTIAADGAVIDADADATVGALLMSSGTGDTDLQIGSGVTLTSAAVTINNNTLLLSDVGTLANSAAIDVGSAGLLDVNASGTVSAVTFSGAGSIDIQKDKTLTATTVTTTADVVILASTGGTTNPGILANSGNFTITDAGTVQLSNDFEISGNLIVETAGTNTGTIDLNAQTLTASGANIISASHVLVLTDGVGSGTFAGDIANSGTMQITGTTPIQTGTITCAVDGAIIDVDSNATIGALTLSSGAGDTDLQIAAGATLTSGAVTVDNNILTFSGDGTLSNSSMTLGTATAVLNITGSGSTMTAVESGHSAAKIEAGYTAPNTATITTLSFTGNNGVEIKFSDTGTLAVTDAFALPTGGTAVLSVSGTGAGTLSGGLITVGAATTLGKVMISNSGGATIANAVQIGGANTFLDIDVPTTISGALTISGAVTFDLSADLTYSNAADIAVGANTLTLTGTGDFLNTGGDINLDNASSILDLIGISQTVTAVESGNDAAKVDVGAAGTIGMLSMTGANGVNIDFTSASQLTITNDMAVPDGGTFSLTGSSSGTLGGGLITVSNGNSTTKLLANNTGLTIGNNVQAGGSNSILDFDANTTLTGTVDVAGDLTIDLSATDGATITQSGSATLTNVAATGATTINFTGTGAGASDTWVLSSGGLSLASSMTFNPTATAVVDYSALQNLVATENATFAPGVTSISLSSIATIGGTGAGVVLSLASPNIDVDYTFTRPLVTSGDLLVKENSLTLNGSGLFTLGSGHTMTVNRPTAFSPTAGIFDPTAGTIVVDIWIDANANGSADILSGEVVYTTLQDAITAASAGDVIMVGSGTYTEDLTIPSTKTNLDIQSVNGAAQSIIQGVADSTLADWPAATPNIEILAAGVKLHGFTVRGPVTTDDDFAGGLVIGGTGAATVTNIEIYDNIFEVTGSADVFTDNRGVSYGIQTKSVVDVAGIDIGGLKIYNNTFSQQGSGQAGYAGVVIRRDVGADSIIVRDNALTGLIYKGIEAEQSKTLITRNQLVTDMVRNEFLGQFGIRVADSTGATMGDIEISHNVVRGADTDKGFSEGIHIGGTGQTSNLSNITIENDTVWYNVEGIQVQDAADSVLIQNCYLSGNSRFGINNRDLTEQGLQLDARYNFWGNGSGPIHGILHPIGIGDGMSDNILYFPWLDAPLGNAVQAFVELGEVADSTCREGDNIVIQLTVSVYTGANSLSYSVVSNIPDTSEMQFSTSDGLFTWTPNFAESGEYQITFGVTDGTLSNTETTTMTITDIDLAVGGLTAITDSAVVVAGVEGTVAVGAGGIYTQHQIVIPPSALAANKTIIARAATASDVSGVSLAATPSAVVFEVRGQESGFVFEDEVTMTLEYKDFEIDQASGESAMRIHYWDSSIGAWKREMSAQSVNRPMNTVTTQVNHLSTFAVMPPPPLSSSMATASGWNMVGVPLEPVPANPEAVFDGINGLSVSEGGSSIYEYDEALNAWTVPTAIQSAYGYIVWDYKNNTLNPSGLEVTGDITQTLSYTNSNGWHLLGNPYKVSVDFQTDVLLSANVDQVYYRWTGSQYEFYPGGNLTQTIDTWEGFWVHTAADNETVTFQYPGIAKPVVATEPAFDWRVQIEAHSGNLQDMHNYFGTAVAGDVQYDALDIYELVPMNREFISAYFAHPGWDGHEGNFTQDIQSATGNSYVWDYTVATNSRQELVLLNWVIPELMDQTLTVILTDHHTNTSIDMRSQSSYTYTIETSIAKAAGPELPFAPDPSDFMAKLAADDVQERHFTITVAPKVAEVEAIPDEFALLSNFPNPFNPETTLRYNLRSEEHVEIIIYNVLGQKVRVLVNERQEAGFRQVKWDSMNDYGVPVASGVYIYRMRSGAYVRSRKMSVIR